ncbi:MAG: class II aldolase/adducin family protein [Elusimicrobia bacterium]|nr:class II aldolase/adducin family protein [Elusimicrobiota bacterium]
MAKGLLPPGRAPAAFVRLCRAIGADPAGCPGTGGNVSIKLDGRRLIIKESGARLSEVTASRGWALVDLAAARESLGGLGPGAGPMLAREAGYALAVRQAACRPGSLPSLETGMHAVLPERFVAHGHSITGMLLGMMAPADAKEFLGRAVGRIATEFIRAALPGLSLGRLLGRPPSGGGAPAAAPPGGVRLWVLANHGVVWASPSAGAILRAHRALESAGARRFGLAGFGPPHPAGSRGCRLRGGPPRAWSAPDRSPWCLCRWPDCRFELRPLFPDFVVYCTMGTADSIRGSAPSRAASGMASPAGTDGPAFVRADERVVLIRASTPKQLADRVEVFHAHALLSTVASAGGFLRRLPKAVARAVAGLPTEIARLGRLRSS